MLKSQHAYISCALHFEGQNLKVSVIDTIDSAARLYKFYAAARYRNPLLRSSVRALRPWVHLSRKPTSSHLTSTFCEMRSFDISLCQSCQLVDLIYGRFCGVVMQMTVNIKDPAAQTARRRVEDAKHVPVLYTVCLSLISLPETRQLARIILRCISTFSVVSNCCRNGMWIDRARPGQAHMLGIGSRSSESRGETEL